MGATLAAVAYIWLAQAIAFLLAPRSSPFSLRVRAGAFWALSAPIVLSLQNPMIILVAVAALLLVLSPLSMLNRTAFFLIAVPAVPVFISVPLPFPGLNYLTDLTHYKLAALIALLPVLFSQDGNKRPSTLRGAGAFLMIYILYTVTLVGLPSNITGGMRFFLDQLLILALPYFAILFALRKTEDIDTFFQAFLIASLILAMVALVSTAKRWDIYATAASLLIEIRDGTLRINATAGTHSLAFHLAAAIVVLEFLRYRLAIGWVQLNLLRVIFLAGMLTADSRGALGGLLVAGCVYTFLMLRSVALRSSMFLVLAVAAIGGVIWLAEGNVDAYDEHGTFSYRQDLLWTSIDYIMRYPFFGDRHFLQNSAFEHLLQGQGIIDITNLYLQVALTFGLLGLALFSCVFVLPPLATGWVLLRVRRSRPLPAEVETWFRATATTVAIAAGWLFLIATTSDVGLTMHLGVVFAALCNALRRVRPVEQPQSTSVPAPGRLAAYPLAPA
jgi:hypothetical protein